MINLDNLKAGDLITVKVDQDDVDNLTSNDVRPSTYISPAQITSISHPPKPKSKLEELRKRIESYPAGQILLAAHFKEFLDILIEQQQNNDGKESGDE